ncbi:unnamed protein product [Arabis nemorensis]|uniref:ZF-HD dimerization-type domain-containing protein n=1 Tax=Arabis nemorensis TaxID=586526 RepID=A0A565BV55_9BRAS|nr:unnamed protein product [Arabis nemorensis]
MELGGKGNAVTSTTTVISTKTIEVIKPHTNPDLEAKPESDPFPVKKETQKPTTRGDQASKYRECQKNHAALTGGHVVDGCCEFMAGGEEGTLGSLKCAACNCHRSFHRKEVYGHRSNNQDQVMITPAFYCSSSSYKAMQPRGMHDTCENIGRRTSSSSEDMRKILSHRNQSVVDGW